MSDRPPAPAAVEGLWSDRAFALTILTFVLLTPPIITIFDSPTLVLGVPVLQIYCFGVWLVSIVVGAFLSARLARTRTPPDALDLNGDAGGE